MENFIGVVQNVILPIVAVLTGIYGWKARSDKNKLEAELEGMVATNTAQDIQNQSSWLDLYKKLHDDQALRMTMMEKEIQDLINNIKKLENALNKIHKCRYYDACPVRSALELQKPERVVPARSHRRPSTNRQREPDDRENDTPDSDAADDSENEYYRQ